MGSSQQLQAFAAANELAKPSFQEARVAINKFMQKMLEAGSGSDATISDECSVQLSGKLVHWQREDGGTWTLEIERVSRKGQPTKYVHKGSRNANHQTTFSFAGRADLLGGA